MKLTGYPHPVPREHYAGAIEEVLRPLRTEPSVQAVYQVGGIRTPGISDVDLLVVFRDGAQCRVDPLAGLSAAGRYLFPHGQFGMPAQSFAAAIRFGFFHDYRLLHGDEPAAGHATLTGADSVRVNHQTGLEYLLKMFISMSVEHTYGIARVRNLLLLGRALRYDLEYVGAARSRLGPLVDQVIGWRDRWFEQRPDDADIRRWFATMYCELEALLRDLLARSPLFIPAWADLRIAGNMVICPAARLGVEHRGVTLPAVLGGLGRRYFNLQHRLNRFRFEVPVTTTAPGDSARAPRAVGRHGRVQPREPAAFQSDALGPGDIPPPGGRLSAPRRILHVLNSGGMGGVERLVLDLARAQKSDPALTVAVFFVQTAAGDFEPRFRALGVPIHAMGLRSGRDLSPVKYRRAVTLLRQFDIIHMHTFNALVALAAVRAGAAVIYTMHGVLAHGRRMRVSDRVNATILRWFLNRRVDLITHNSRATQALAGQRYGLEHVPNQVVYNGIAFDAAAEPADGLDADIAAAIAGRFVVGTSTRFATFKRIDRLIDGFALLARRHPEARLLLVGDGVLRPELEAQVARLGLAAQTLFAGFRANVRPYQQAMSVCVFPSASEPFGLVAVEALALGKPVLVFADGGGMVEVVAPCAADDVVADVEALARRLDYYATHPAELMAGTGARHDYARRFDISRTALEFRRHYLDLVPCVA